MKSILLFLALIMVPVKVFLQPTFEKAFGTPREDGAYDMAICPDGGFILAGFTTDMFYDHGAYLVRTDVNGGFMWSKSIVFPGKYTELYALINTMDGGFLGAGRIYEDNSGRSILIRMNSNGDTLWTRKYTFFSDEENAFTVIQTPDSGFVFCGTSYQGKGQNILWTQNIFIAKIDQYGNSLWFQTIGPPNSINLVSHIIQSSDDGFIICGQHDGLADPGSEALLIKTNGQGIQQWYRTYGGVGRISYASCVNESPDGGYIICGSYFPSIYILPGSGDLFLIKTQSNGDMIWSKTYGGDDRDLGYSVDIAADENGYIFCGSTMSFDNGDEDLYLLHTDLDGDSLWALNYGGAGYEIGYTVFTTNDDGYVACGLTDSFGTGMSDAYLVKTDKNGLITGIDENPSGTDQIRIYPNPVSEHATIEFNLVKEANVKIIVFNCLGQQVSMPVNLIVSPGMQSFTWSLNDIADGVYFLKITLDGRIIPYQNKIIRQSK